MLVEKNKQHAIKIYITPWLITSLSHMNIGYFIIIIIDIR